MNPLHVCSLHPPKLQKQPKNPARLTAFTSLNPDFIFASLTPEQSQRTCPGQGWNHCPWKCPKDTDFVPRDMGWGWAWQCWVNGWNWWSWMAFLTKMIPWFYSLAWVQTKQRQCLHPRVRMGSRDVWRGVCFWHPSATAVPCHGSDLGNAKGMVITA